MVSRDLDYAVIAGMLLSGAYAALSGLMVDLLGIHQFAFHRCMGYACASLAGVHLALNWSRVTAYVRRRLGRTREWDASAPGPGEGAPLVGRRDLLVSALSAAGGFLLGQLISLSRTAELPDDAADIGELYHQWSKPGYSQALGAVLDWGGRLGRYKSYPDAEQIGLPDRRGYEGLSLEQAVENRRSIRTYGAQPLTLQELSRLLHTAQGITDRAQEFRAAPSAGALYPIETYAVVHGVADLELGLYHYNVADHSLERLRADDLRGAMVVAGAGQEMPGQAQVCFVLSAIFQRSRWKYRERAYRYVLLEAGHVGQNIYLAATSMGLGACAVGAFLDDQINDLLGLDGKEEAALYLLSVGKV